MASLPTTDIDSKPEWYRHLIAHGYAVIPDVVDAEVVQRWKDSLRRDISAFTAGAVDLGDLA